MEKHCGEVWGSAKQQMRDAPLLSAVRHDLGLTRGQEAVLIQKNEMPALKRLLDGLVVKGEVFTIDARLTQKDIARPIVAKGGFSRKSPHFVRDNGHGKPSASDPPFGEFVCGTGIVCNRVLPVCPDASWARATGNMLFGV